MKIKLLGTGAREGIPSVFCNCKLCRTATKKGGKNTRARSGTLINDKILIDLSQDIFFHRIRFRLKLSKIKGIVFTHSHGDHLSIFSLSNIVMPVFCRREESVVNVFGNSAVKKIFDEQGLNANADQLPFTEIKDGSTFSVAGVNFTAIKTIHSTEEECLIYLVEQDGKKLLFGHDSAVFSDHVYESLKGHVLDCAILDCCHSLAAPRGRHMNLNQCIEVKQRMLSEGIANANTRFVITHFTHNGGATHEDICEAATPHQIETAYDGMEIDI